MKEGRMEWKGGGGRTEKVPFTETADIKIEVVPRDDLDPSIDPVTYTITPEGSVLLDSHPEIFHLKT
eukprot:gene29153-36155_t